MYECNCRRNTDLDKITEVALGLTRNERAQLLDAIEYSLLSGPERAEQDAWFKEIEGRAAEVETREGETIDDDQIMAEARTMLSPNIPSVGLRR